MTKPRFVPVCPDCLQFLSFDYKIGKMVDYQNGLKVILDCPRCNKKYVCESERVLKEHIM